MATQLFLRRDGNPSGGANLGSGLGLFVDPGFLSASTHVVSASGLSASRGAGAVDISAGNSLAGPQAFFNFDSFISLPVAAAFTMSGTVTFNVWGREEGDANAGLIARVYRARDSDGSLTLVCEQAKGTELSNPTNAVNNWTDTPTSTAFAVGDRIVVFVGSTDAGGTMNAGFLLAIRTDGATGGASGDSYVTFTEDITFQDATAPAGATLYLTDDASEVDPGAGKVAKRLQTSRGAGVVTRNFQHSDFGSTPTPGVLWTATAGGDGLEWYSDRFNAFTLGGKIRVNLRGRCPTLGLRSAMVAELAIVDQDGANASVVAKQLLCASDQAYLTTSESARDAILALPDTTFDAGKRLRLRVYADDAYVESDDPASTTGTAELKYAGTTGGASGDAFITLTQSPTDFEEPQPPSPVTHAYVVQSPAVY